MYAVELPKTSIRKLFFFPLADGGVAILHSKEAKRKKGIENVSACLLD